MTAISAIALQYQAIEPQDLDFWDFCLRKVLVQKATALEVGLIQMSLLSFSTLRLLGRRPGAKNILPKLTDKKLPVDERVDSKKNPRSLDELSIDHFFVDQSNR